MSEAQDSPPFDGREFVRELTVAPGVYRMLAADGSALYVGKAMSLKKRVSSYFRADQPSPRCRAVRASIACTAPPMSSSTSARRAVSRTG